MVNELKVKVTQVNQFDNCSAFFGVLTARNLLDIVRYTNRVESNDNPIRSRKEGIEANDESEDNSDLVFFQREWDEKRLTQIVEYINKQSSRPSGESIPLFPTPIIISLDENEEGSTNIKDLENSRSVTVKDDEIIIPLIENLALIVDGQHRLKAIEKYAKDKSTEIFKLDLPVIFLVGLDSFRLSEVFVNINFEQRKVNKSLYYDIFGTLPETQELKLAHELVLFLNNDSKSPFEHKINLLGKGDGYFSQAQFVDIVHRYFKLKSIWREAYELYIDGQHEKLWQIADFMLYYFSILKELYPSVWRGDTPKFDYGYILCKSTGISAYLRLIKDIFPLVKNNSGKELGENLRLILTKLSDDDAKKLFDRNGEFGSGSSYGLQAKLYKRLRHIYKLDV
jgi:DGQHR domain-containing protein